MLAILHPLASFFASPFWLLLLLPWALLAIYLFIGQRNRVAVPFLPLWDNTLAAPKTKRSFHAPPVAIVLLLLAMLMGILAAAGPQFRNDQLIPVVALVDRGITMSPEDRLLNTTGGITTYLWHHVFFVEPIAVPDTPMERTDLPPRPMAIDTHDQLLAAIDEQLGRDSTPVAVISDQVIERNDRRLVQITPDVPVENAGIVSVSARATPHAQVMVRVRNQAALTNASITVRSGNASQTQQIQLPARDAEQNYFIDLPKLEDVVEVKLDAKDDFPIDNVAWLVRTSAWPRIEPVDPLSAEVQRMVAVYEKNRPASANSSNVVVATEVAHLPGGRPGIAIASGSASPIDPKQLTIVPHELTRDIDWNAIANSASNATLPAADWAPLVRAGDRVLLAIRPSDRQAFVAIDPRTAASSSQFVVLWGKLFDWSGQGGERYATDRVHAIDDTWKLVVTDESAKRYDPPLPGVYRRIDGAMLAMSALDVRFSPPAPVDFRRLDELRKSAAEATSLRPLTLGLALLILLAALAMLKPRRLV